jgi:hypothetical protein
MCTDLHVKCLLVWSDYNQCWIFSTNVRKFVKYQISWKSVQWETRRVVSCGQTDRRTDGRTDMTKVIIPFRNFANAPKHSTFCPQSVFMCFVWIWVQTAITFLYSINWLVFITETVSAYCAVRTGYLNTIKINLSLQMCNFVLKIPPAGSSRCSKTYLLNEK